MKINPIRAALFFLLLSLGQLAGASAPAAREICKQFISKSGYSIEDWGESWDWKTIDNNDQAWNVGARFNGFPPGGVRRNLYVVCHARKNGDNWRLEGLTRLQ